MNIINLSIDPKLLEAGSAVQERFLEYAKLAERFDVIVYTKPGYKSYQLAPNATIYPTNTAFKPFYFFHAWRIAHRLLVRKKTLISSQEAMTSLLGILLKFLYGAKLEVQIHTDFLSEHFRSESLKNRARSFLYAVTARRADRVRVVSERLKEGLVERLRIPAQRITVVPIYVDIENIKRQKPAFDLHEKYGHFNFTFLVVSRLEKEKRVDIAIEAMSRVLKKYPEAGLVIVGDGSLRKTLEAQTALLNIESHVVFEGWQTDTVSYYKGAHAYLLTSSYEGYGLSIVEAAASGCPIISTGVGIVGSLFKDNESALVCSIGNMPCFVQHMEQVMTDHTLREALQKGAYKALEAVQKERKEHLKAYVDSWSI